MSLQGDLLELAVVSWQKILPDMERANMVSRVRISIAYNGQGLAMWRYSVIRQPKPKLSKNTKDDDMFCCSSVLRLTELKPNSEQKAENIFVTPPYSQAACWLLY